MATSDSVDFTVTAKEIIKDALLLIGRLARGKSPTAPEEKDVLRMLNMMVKSWQTTFNLWKKEDFTIPLYDGNQSYSIGPDGNKSIDRPLQVSQVRRLLSSGIENPIWNVARQVYMEQPNKDSDGPPNMTYYDPQITDGQGTLFVWPVSNTDSVSLSDGTTDQWTDSPTTAGEYYYTGTDITAEPTFVFAGGTELTEGVLGSLVNDEYAWGDQDTLGADTLYVKVSEGDPDAQASGFIKVLTTTPDRVIVTFQMPLQDFDLASNNPDFPQEWYLGIVYNLAVVLSPQFGMTVRPDIKVLADQFRYELESFDTEPATFQVTPSYQGYS